MQRSEQLLSFFCHSVTKWHLCPLGVSTLAFSVTAWDNDKCVYCDGLVTLPGVYSCILSRESRHRLEGPHDSVQLLKKNVDTSSTFTPQSLHLNSHSFKKTYNSLRFEWGTPFSELSMALVHLRQQFFLLGTYMQNIYLFFRYAFRGFQNSYFTWSIFSHCRQRMLRMLSHG